MKRRIKRIAALQAGKMTGVLYACLALIFLPFFILAAAIGMFAPHGNEAQGAGAIFAGSMFVMALAMPVIYGVMGFIFGVIGAAIYNLIARWIGGIEVEIEQL